MESDTLVRLEHVEIAMDGEVILRDANFTLHAGEFVYLIGRVGSGKSSFLRALYAELPIKTGEATIMGYDLRGITLRDTAALRRRLGIVFQDFQLLTDRTVRLNLEFILRATGWKNPDDIDRRIAETLTRTGIPDKAERMISPEVNSNAWPSLEPCSTPRPSSWPMSLRATSTRRPDDTSSASCTTSAAAGRPS